MPMLVLIGIAAISLLLAACDEDANGNGDGQTGDQDEATWDQTIVFADQSFDSVNIHNRIAGYILEHGYGYETDSTLTETAAMVQGIRNDDITLTMEMWVDNIPNWEQYVEDGEIADLGTNYPESIQGWFVPTYVIEGDPERGIEPMAPDLESVDDLPQYTDVFQDPEDPDKGRFYDCIAGWECEQINAAKIEAYGLDDDYNRFRPGSGAALATSIVSAVEQGEPWFGYYWAPTWIFAEYDLTQIEEPEYTEECWDQILSGEEACAYPAVEVHVAANPEFAEQAPDAIEFLRNYDSTMEGTSEMLLRRRENEEDPQDTAIWWLQNNEDTWSEWVPDDVAEQVRTALDEEG